MKPAVCVAQQLWRSLHFAGYINNARVFFFHWTWSSFSWWKFMSHLEWPRRPRRHLSLADMQNDCIDLLLQNWTDKVTYKSKFPFLKKMFNSMKYRDVYLNRENKKNYLQVFTWEKIETNFIVLGISDLDSKFLKSNCINSS